MTGRESKNDAATTGRLTRFPWLAAGGLVALVFIVYAPTLSSDFVLFDDPQYVYENPLMMKPSWNGVWRLISEIEKPSTVAGYYQPLTMLSLMLDRVLSGGEGEFRPAIFHFHNIALHGVMAILVMSLMRALGADSAIAFLLAVVFAVHPANVESVAWIAQRKTVLASPLAIGGLLCHLRSVRTGRTVWHATAIALYVLATLAKPTIVLMPLVLPLLAWMTVNPPSSSRGAAATGPRATVIRTLPYALWMILMSVVALISQAKSQATLGVPNLASLHVLTRWLGLLAYNLMLYLGNVVWPMHLAPFRAVPESLALSGPPILASVVGLGVFVSGMVWSFRRARPTFAALAAYCLLLAPAMGPVRFFDSCVADRFLYVPMVFLFQAVAPFLSRRMADSPRSSRLTVVALLALCVPLWVLTRAQQTIWRDGKTFWSHVVETVPDYGIGHLMRGLVALEENDLNGLYEHSRRAAEILPNEAPAQALWGRANLLRGDAVAAERILRDALARELSPDASAVHLALAETLASRGRTNEARKACEAAIASGATAMETYLHVGEMLLSRLRRYDFAAECYRKVVELDASNRQARWNLGTCLEAMGDEAQALAAYESALAGYESTEIPTALREAVTRLRGKVRISGASSTTHASEP